MDTTLPDKQGINLGVPSLDGGPENENASLEYDVVSPAEVVGAVTLKINTRGHAPGKQTFTLTLQMMICRGRETERGGRKGEAREGLEA